MINRKIGIQIIFLSAAVVAIVYCIKLYGFSVLITKFLNLLVNPYFNSMPWILIVGLMTVSIFGLEIFFLGWRKSSLFKILARPGKSIQNDIFSYLFLITQIHTVIGYAFALGTIHFLPAYIPEFLRLDLLKAVQSPFLQFLIFFIIIDFLDYWLHRAEHHFTFLWKTHEFHHSTNEFVVLSAKRVHPFNDIVLKRYFFAIPLVLLGTPVQSYIAFQFLREALSLLQHSRLNTDLGWLGQWLLVSPHAHQIHHLINPDGNSCNYGTIFNWWDKLFGTWDISVVTGPIGVEGSTHNQHNYFYNIYYSFIALLENLLLSIKKFLFR